MRGAVKLAMFSTRVRAFTFCDYHGLIDIPLDNDDDGETAAGGRLAHLLQILVRLACSILMTVPTHAILGGE